MRKYSSYPLLLSTVRTLLCFFFLFIHFEPEHAVLSFLPCPWISPKALCQARQPDAASEIPGISAARGAGGSLERSKGMEKQPVSAQPLLSSGARGKKGATAVADAVESPRTADFDLWEDAPPEKDARCCGVSRRCGVALVAALSVAAVGGFFLSSRRTRPITEGLIGCGTKEQVCARHAPSPVLSA